MRDGEILKDIQRCMKPDALFDLMVEYFNGQGFNGVVYVAPESAVGPYVLHERGMPKDWMERYRAQGLNRVDPIPGMAFQLGHPERLDALLKKLTNLSEGEREFIAAFKRSGISNGLAVPTFGPFGRPALIGLCECAHPDLLDQIDVPLVAAVAQQVHIRMELLQIKKPPPGLSPREREILGWLAKGKSQTDIAAILDIKAPTVATHVRRLYHKLGAHDRTKAVLIGKARHLV